MREIWKDVNHPEPLLAGFKISSEGNLRMPDGLPAKTHVSTHGYWVFHRSRKHKTLTFSIHVLVARAFLVTPDKKQKYQVNHIDGVKTNNRVSNLEYVTHGQNILHAFTTRLHDLMFTDEQIRDIRHRSCTRGMGRKLAKEFGCTPAMISQIKLRKQYYWVSDVGAA